MTDNSDIEKEIRQKTRVSRFKAFSSIYFTFIVITLLWHFFTYQTTSDYPFIFTFKNVELNDYLGCSLVFFFVIIHTIRMWLGLSFMEEDKSFENAKKTNIRKKYEKGYKGLCSNQKLSKLVTYVKRKNIADVILRTTLYLTFLILCFTLRYGSYAVISFLLFFQTIIIIAVDIMYFKELAVYDADNKLNLLIFIGDGFIIIFTIGLLAKLFPSENVKSWVLITVFLVILSGVFVAESISLYIAALKLTYKQIRTIAILDYEKYVRSIISIPPE